MNTKVAFALAFALSFTGIIGNHAEAGHSKPDLIVSAISASSSTTPGTAIIVSGTIKNQGKASSNAFTVAAYLSASPSNTKGAALLGTQNISGLAAGESVTLAGSITVPETTASGKFYLVGVADSTKVISESNERNNIKASGAIVVQDVAPPTISAVSSTEITVSSVIITWITDKASTSQVEYGLTTTYGNLSTLDTTKITSHDVILSGLAAATTYHFRVRSTDAAGKSALSGDYAFTTAEMDAPAASTIGTTYYVATTGSDANPGTETQPFRTLAQGVSVLTPGDTLYIMSGTYAEALLDNIPPGTSWNVPVTVAAAPGHTVTLKPNPGAGWVLHFQGPQQYIVIDGLTLDATNVTHDAVKITAGGNAGAAHHIRLIDCEVMHSPGQGILVTQFADSNEFIGLDVHDNGSTRYDHGFYISTSNNLVDGSTVHQNTGYGVHIYNGYTNQQANNNTVRNNRIFGNGYVEGGAGIILGSGDGNMAYNNVVWRNAAGIKVAYGYPSNAGIYNNTIYANSTYGIYIHTDSASAVVQNNLFYANGLPEIQNYGVGSVVDHNLKGTDPQFVNAPAWDFSLQPGSPAIDTGISLNAVAQDIAGTPRPQGAAYDVGAFERGP